MHKEQNVGGVRSLWFNFVFVNYVLSRNVLLIVIYIFESSSIFMIVIEGYYYPTLLCVTIYRGMNNWIKIKTLVLHRILLTVNFHVFIFLFKQISSWLESNKCFETVRLIHLSFVHLTCGQILPSSDIVELQFVHRWTLC